MIGADRASRARPTPNPRRRTVNDIVNSSPDRAERTVTGRSRLRVQLLDLLRVAVGDHPPAPLHRGRELARLRGPLGWEQGEPADPLGPGQVRVRRLPAAPDLREDPTARRAVGYPAA